jgi:hypothetical protein
MFLFYFSALRQGSYQNFKTHVHVVPETRVIFIRYLLWIHEDLLQARIQITGLSPDLRVNIDDEYRVM